VFAAELAEFPDNGLIAGSPGHAIPYAGGVGAIRQASNARAARAPGKRIVMRGTSGIRTPTLA